MIWLVMNLITCFFFKDNEIGDDLKLKTFQNDKATEPEESLTLKPFYIPKSQEKPSHKPDSKPKSESEPKLSKHPKNLDECAKNDDVKTGVLETPNNKIDADKDTIFKLINAPTLDQEDTKVKKDKFMVEEKPGDTAFLVVYIVIVINVPLFILLVLLGQ